jgi:hypothetical protein
VFDSANKTDTRNTSSIRNQIEKISYNSIENIPEVAETIEIDKNDDEKQSPQHIRDDSMEDLPNKKDLLLDKMMMEDTIKG